MRSVTLTPRRLAIFSMVSPAATVTFSPVMVTVPEPEVDPALVVAVPAGLVVGVVARGTGTLSVWPTTSTLELLIPLSAMRSATVTPSFFEIEFRVSPEPILYRTLESCTGPVAVAPPGTVVGGGAITGPPPGVVLGTGLVIPGPGAVLPPVLTSILLGSAVPNVGNWVVLVVVDEAFLSPPPPQLANKIAAPTRATSFFPVRIRDRLSA